MSKIALIADKSFGRSNRILIVRITQLTGGDGSDNINISTKKMFEHLVARMGY